MWTHYSSWILICNVGLFKYASVFYKYILLDKVYNMLKIIKFNIYVSLLFDDFTVCMHVGTIKIYTHKKVSKLWPQLYSTFVSFSAMSISEFMLFWLVDFDETSHEGAELSILYVDAISWISIHRKWSKSTNIDGNQSSQPKLCMREYIVNSRCYDGV